MKDWRWMENCFIIIIMVASAVIRHSCKFININSCFRKSYAKKSQQRFSLEILLWFWERLLKDPSYVFSAPHNMHAKSPFHCSHSNIRNNKCEWADCRVKHRSEEGFQWIISDILWQIFHNVCNIESETSSLAMGASGSACNLFPKYIVGRRQIQCSYSN